MIYNVDTRNVDPFAKMPFIIMVGKGKESKKVWFDKVAVDGKRYEYETNENADTTVKLILSSVADFVRVKDRKLRGFRIIEVGNVEAIGQSQQEFLQELALAQREVEENKRLLDFEAKAKTSKKGE